MVSSMPLLQTTRSSFESRYHCSPPSNCSCLQEPRLADMESLPYTSAVLKEVTLMYPPAGVATWEASSDIEVGLMCDEFCAASDRVDRDCIMSTNSQAVLIL